MFRFLHRCDVVLLETVPTSPASRLFRFCSPQLVSQQRHTMLSPSDATHLPDPNASDVTDNACIPTITGTFVGTNLLASVKKEQALCCESMGTDSVIAFRWHVMWIYEETEVKKDPSFMSTVI